MFVLSVSGDLLISAVIGCCTAVDGPVVFVEFLASRISFAAAAAVDADADTDVDVVGAVCC